LGPVTIDSLNLEIELANTGLSLVGTATVGIALGPVAVAVDGIGTRADLEFKTGNMGPMDFSAAFVPPAGLGIAIDAGPVSGGGFLSFEDGRYSGALELSIYKIAVKAFGLLETKLPDGRKGYSFVIVISAEFTPIQLGFGFTLVGVGGLVGINRALNTEGLQQAVRTGSLDHLLFPRNPNRDAPAIINDLATVFPASPNHYVFGPMAKLGWGTPTLITGKLGIILELPGPRLAVLGIVQMALPTSRAALLAINMAVAGILDFPKRRLSIDASLYDSQVVGFRISGDMAFRVGWGDQPNFALAVGGFNPSYQPPPDFPQLRRVAVDLGINGNPSLTLSGYFALTPNTAQVGAAIDLHASGFGIHLDGHLGFDALFVFSPFSFTAAFSASVSVSFHGVGLGVGLNGSISGPTPWDVHAEACVSVLWWDACLPIHLTFGGGTQEPLPQLDPWEGQKDEQDDTRNIIGLRTAIEDSHNWSGGLPSGAHSVVTLADAVAGSDAPPIDPAGQATLRQRVVPLNMPIAKFGIFQPKTNTHFDLGPIKLNGIAQPNPRIEPDLFAPGLFKDLSAADKLSAPPYELHDAGFTIAPDNVQVPNVPSSDTTVKYENLLLDGNIESRPELPELSKAHLLGMLPRSAPALGGVRRSGTERFVNPEAPVQMRLVPERFVVADSCSLVRNTDVIDGDAVSYARAQAALDAYIAIHPEARGSLRVVAHAA
jgi:hypothetical protein